MRADQMLLEQRLEEITALWLEGATRPQIIQRLQSPGPLPGCTVCSQRPEHACKHGPPRWCDEQGNPMPARTISWYLQKAKARVFEQSWSERKHNRLLTLAQLERAIARCFQQNQLKELATFLRFRSEIDGTKLATAEAEAPTLFEQVCEQMALVQDYQPSPKPKQRQRPSQIQARWMLQRVLKLLKEADPSIAAYQQTKRPTNDVEARLYLRIQIVEAIHQSLTHPDLTPEGKREALQKLGSTYAMIAKDEDLAEHLTELKEMLHQIQIKNQTSS